MSDIEFNGTGGIIEGNLGAANVNVNLDAAYNFNGSDDEYITIADNSALDLGAGDFTLSCWTNAIYANQGSSYNTLIAKGVAASGGSSYALNILADGSIFFKAGDGQFISSAAGKYPNDGSFAHIAGVKNGTNFKIYVNGVEVVSQTRTDVDTDNNDALNLGGDTGASRHITGKLGDVRIYNTALSASNIQVLASKINVNQELGAGTTNLVGRWPIIGTSIDITDNSSNSNNGTAVNSPTTVYDSFSVDVYDGSDTRTTGTFTVTQGKVEGLALSSINCDGSNDKMDVASFDFRGTAPSYTVAFWMKPNTITRSEIQSLVFQDQKFYVRQVEDDIIFAPNYGTEFTASAKLLSHTNWFHVVCTFNDSDNAVAVYVNGVLATSGTDSTANTTGANQMYFGAKGDNTHDYQGMFRDIRLYDYCLKSESVASLYSNTYPQTPEHWWRVDEGSGTSIEDFGTGTDQDGTLNGATISNGTLDLDGTLTIAANGTLSAPRGTLEMEGASSAFTFKNFATNGFIHNNGTVDVDGSTTSNPLIIDDDSVATTKFYNLTISNDHQIRTQNSITVENNYTLGSSTYGHIFEADILGSKLTFTMGTSTEGGIMNLNAELLRGANDSQVLAVVGACDTDYTQVNTNPFDFDFDDNGTWELKNLNFNTDITTAGNGLTLRLTGDCEFDAVTVSSGDTLDFNGNHVRIAGTLNSNSDEGLKDTAGNAILVVDDANLGENAHSSCQNTHYIGIGTGSQYIQRGNFKTVMTNAGDNASTFNNYGPNSTNTNLICASKTTGGFGTTGGSSNPTIMNNVTVPTTAGYTSPEGLKPQGNEMRVSGDFTTSGGLIGKSGLDFDGSTATASPFTFLDVPYDLTNLQNSDATIEMWINPESKSGDAKQAGIINGYVSGQTNRWQFDHTTSDTFIFNSHENNRSITFTPNIGKMNHIAIVFDDSENLLQIYHDGKLVGQNTLGTGIDLGTVGADPDLGISWQTTAKDTIRSNYMGFKGQFYMYRIFNTARTPAQLRADMFNTHGNMASTTGLQVMYQFDEGTGGAGDTVDNKEGTASRDGVLSNSGAAPNWVGAGTFTQGTSTVDMTGDGTLTYQGDIDFNILKCAAATKTTTISRLSTGYININTNLYKGAGTLARGSSLSWRWSWKTGTGAVNNSGLSVSGASYPVDLSNTYVVYYHDVTIAKEVKWNYFINGSDTTLAANQETTGYWNTALYKTDIGDYDLKCHHMKMEGPSNASSSQVNIDAGSLEFSSTNGLLQSYPDNVFTAGPGARIYGSDVALSYTFKSQNNFVVVGNISNLNVTNEELSVTGQVINCTGEIHQQFPTIDHDQQLDFDTADDRDIILGRDLDKNTELINS